MNNLKVVICNQALGLVGDSRIESLEESSVEARICRQFFEPILDEVLREFRWNFALKVEPLSYTGTALDMKQHRYKKPKECVFVAAVYGSAGPQKVPATFRIVGDDIWCNIEQAVAEYVSNSFELGRMDSLFRSAFVHRLAAEICTDLTESPGKKNQILQIYFEALAKAKVASAQESREEADEHNPYIDARS